MFSKKEIGIQMFSLQSSVRPVLEYWSACRGGQMNALDRLQHKAAQFTNHTKDSDWETLVQRRTVSRLFEV